MLHVDWLEEVAKSISSESFVVPSHAAFSTTDLTLDPAMTSFDGEVEDRATMSLSRIQNVVSITGIRSGAEVSSSSGETLYETALFSASSGGTLLSMESLPGILHTTSFDVETNVDVFVESR